MEWNIRNSSRVDALQTPVWQAGLGFKRFRSSNLRDHWKGT